MAYPSGNALYPKWKTAGWQEQGAYKSLDQTGTNGVYCCLVQIQAPNPNISYTYDNAHAFYTDLTAPNGLPPGSQPSAVFNVGGSPNPGALQQQITNATLNIVGAAPVFDGDDVTFLQVTNIFAGFNSVGALVLFRMSPAASNSWRLIYYCDTGAGFPVVPNSGNVTIQWNASGIFAI
jgi:hypothetical protein